MRWHLGRMALAVLPILLYAGCQETPVEVADQPELQSLELQLSVDEESSHTGDIAFVIELSNAGSDTVRLDSSSGNIVLDLAVEDTTGTEVWRRSEAGWPVVAQQREQGQKIVLPPGDRFVWTAVWQRFEQLDRSGNRLDAGTYDVHAELVRNRGDSGDGVALASADPVTVRLVHD